MFYYKVPVVNGQTDCSAGSILCCAYPQGNYMVCKFESVANVGSNWVEITEEEFEANRPEFPPIDPGNKPGTAENLMVTYDWNTGKASHSASEINAHLNSGGSATLALCQFQDDEDVMFYVPVFMRTPTFIWFYQYEVYEDSVSGTIHVVDDEKNYTYETFSFTPSGSAGKTFEKIKVTEHADGSVTMYNTFTDGTSETIGIGAGNTPGISYNSVAIPTEWVTEVSE